jgi:hypothetical protein
MREQLLDSGTEADSGGAWHVDVRGDKIDLIVSKNLPRSWHTIRNKTRVSCVRAPATEKIASGFFIVHDEYCELLFVVGNYVRHGVFTF